jgi:hypothetical protein
MSIGAMPFGERRREVATGEAARQVHRSGHEHRA